MKALALSAWLFLPVAARQEMPATPIPMERQVSVKEGETVQVRVRVSTREEHYSTVVRFPEPIAHVVSSWDPSQISVQDQETRLVLKLQVKAEGFLDIVLAGGTLVRLFISGVAAPAPFDSAVAIRLPAAPGPAEAKSAPRGGGSGALELIRAMRLGEVPPDATVRTGQNSVLFRSRDIQVTVLYVYETARYRGSVLSLENLSARESYPLDVSRFGGDSLVLVGARELLVGPGRSTRLYIVDWK
jgi:hypothetical protein